MRIANYLSFSLLTHFQMCSKLWKHNLEFPLAHVPPNHLRIQQCGVLFLFYRRHFHLRLWLIVIDPIHFDGPLWLKIVFHNCCANLIRKIKKTCPGFFTYVHSTKCKSKHGKMVLNNVYHEKLPMEKTCAGKSISLWYFLIVISEYSWFISLFGFNANRILPTNT